MAELKPCPFCGGKAFINKGCVLYWVSCQECGTEGSTRASDNEAIAAWNTRAERTCHIVHDGHGWWERDSCGTSYDWDSVDENDPPSCNYCPNCGAKVVD